MAKKRVYAHIILDRSGSMGGTENSTIKAINDYVDGVAKDAEISSRVSLTLFDTEGIDLIANNVRGREFKPLDRDTYKPRASTPLYDAIGQTVLKIDEQTRRDGENVVLVILTDGMENASRQFNKAKIDAMLKDRQEKKNWLVIYLGAEHDAFAQAGSIGAMVANTVEFDKSNFIQTSSYMENATKRFAKSGGFLRAAAATNEERASMVVDKTKVKSGAAGQNGS